MRFLIIGINFHPEPTSTGKYTGELAAFFAGRGHQVHVITAPPYYPHWRIQSGYSGWRYGKESWQGVEIQRCPLWVPRKPNGLTRLIHLSSFALSSLPALVAQRGWKPDVILCIAPAIMNAPFVLGLARLSGARAWLHIQDFELDAALRLGLLPGGNLLASLAARIERALLNGFDHVSTISNRMLAHLHNKGVPQNKTSLLPNWVDTKLIFPLGEDSNPLRTSLALADDQVVVLYAGNMGKKQGLEQILIAARQLKENNHIQFILCGDGAIRAELEIAAKDLPNIRFLPVQPFEKLNQLLNMADIHIMLQKANAADLVMPSKLSGMLASGKVVIATAHPDTELGQVVSAVGVLIPPEDLTALTGAILDLANSPARRLEFGKKGRDYAVKNWDSVVVLRQFEKNLQNLSG